MRFHPSHQAVRQQCARRVIVAGAQSHRGPLTVPAEDTQRIHVDARLAETRGHPGDGTRFILDADKQHFLAQRMMAGLGERPQRFIVGMRMEPDDAVNMVVNDSISVAHPAVNLRNDPALPASRRALEFVPATPLEYLKRWLDANDLFHDDVNVVEWSDGRLSFGITQPQYDGEPAPLRDIITYFQASGWTWIADPAGDAGHLHVFRYPWVVLAVDALPRNCFLHDDALLPFDVILSRPDGET